jgi:hypothetical protein
MDPKSINVHQYLLTKGRNGKKKSAGSPAPAQQQQRSKSNAPRDVTNVVRSNAGSATPAIVKRKQIMKQSGFISSPTDSVLSPCSQKLWKREQPDMANVAKFNLADTSMDEIQVDADPDVPVVESS